MRTFAVDKNNDLHLGSDGHLAVNTGLRALTQTCEHAMRSLLGEMVFARNRGVPYRETVWGPAPNLRLFEDHARATLAAVEGVQRVTAFECEKTENTLRYRAVIQSVYGTFELGGKERNA